MKRSTQKHLEQEIKARSERSGLVNVDGRWGAAQTAILRCSSGHVVLMSRARVGPRRRVAFALDGYSERETSEWLR